MRQSLTRPARESVRFPTSNLAGVTSSVFRRRAAQIIFVVAAALTCLALGWWQWQRYESTGGTGQNLGYALQWPLFAVFVVYAYRRFLQLEKAPDSRPTSGSPTEIPEGVLPARPGAVATASGSGATEPEDAELAAYNAYLADLNAVDRSRSQ